MQDYLNTDLIKFIYAFGIGQAVLLFVLLFKRNVNKVSNRFLALVFLLCAIELTSGLFYLGNYYKEYPQFIGLTNGFAYLFGPLMYFYIYFLESENKLSFSKIYIHFIPFGIAYLSYVIPVIGASAVEKLNYVDQQFAINLPTTIFGILAPFHSAIYIVFLLKEVSKIVNSIENNYSILEFVNLYWLKYFFYGVFFQIIIIVGLHIVEATYEFDIKYIMLLSVAIFMILAGYISLRQPEVKSFVTEPVKKSEDKKEYKRPTIKENDINPLINKLITILEEKKPFLNPKLSLKDLSDQTGISTHNLTELLNTQLNKTFYDLINGYRVEEVKRLIKEDPGKAFSLLALAYDAGFSSKTSFNTIFKKYVKVTPSEYRNKILQ